MTGCCHQLCSANARGCSTPVSRWPCLSLRLHTQIMSATAVMIDDSGKSSRLEKENRENYELVAKHPCFDHYCFHYRVSCLGYNHVFCPWLSSHRSYRSLVLIEIVQPPLD